jgi:hypothetical protein
MYLIGEKEYHIWKGPVPPPAWYVHMLMLVTFNTDKALSDRCAVNRHTIMNQKAFIFYV